MISFFPASCLVQAPYLVKFTLHNLKGIGTLNVCICIYNIRHNLTKRVSFCSSFKALSTDTKIGVLCCALSGNVLCFV